MVTKNAIYILPAGEEYFFTFYYLTGRRILSCFSVLGEGHTFIPPIKYDHFDSCQDYCFDYVAISKENLKIYSCHFHNEKTIDLSDIACYLRFCLKKFKIALPDNIFRSFVQAAQVRGVHHVRNAIHKMYLMKNEPTVNRIIENQLSYETCICFFRAFSRVDHRQVLHEIFELQRQYAVVLIENSFEEFIRWVRGYLLNPEEFLYYTNIQENYKRFVTDFVHNRPCSGVKLMHKVNYYLYAPREKTRSDEANDLIHFMIDVLSFHSWGE